MVGKTKVELLILALILAGGLTYGYFELILRSQLADISDTKIQIETGQSDLKKLRQIKSDIKGTLDRITGLEEEIKALDTTIPDYGGVSEFNLQLYHTIKARGLTLNNLEPQKSETGTAGSQYGAQDININVVGNRKQVVDFIKYLQKNSRKVKIKEAAIKVVNAEELNAVIKAQVFFINER